MALLHLPDETNAPMEARGVLQATRSRWGYIPDLVRALSIRPDIMRAEDTWARAVMYEGLLGRRLKQHVATVVATVERSEYCTSAAIHQARLNGVPPLESERCRNLDFSTFDEEDRAALEFARDTAKDPHATAQSVHALRQFFSDGQIIELVSVIGSFRMYATFASALGLAVDTQADRNLLRPD